MNRKKKILVTGATGFIGFELSRYLSEKGLRPSLLVRRPARSTMLECLDAEIIQGDLTSFESLRRACEGIDAVIHLGARAVFEEYDRVKNTIVDGSCLLMRAALEAGVGHFVFASSLLVYDSHFEPIDRSTKIRPRCGYGVAKAEAERQLAALTAGTQMKLAVLRLPHVYGPMDLMFEQVRNGRVCYPGNGKNIFSHLHVRDAARLLTEVVNKEWLGTCPVADEIPVDWNEYFAVIRRYYPRFKAYPVPMWLALLSTWLIYPIRRMQKKPSVYTPGSVISWNLKLPVKKGLLWDDLELNLQYPTVYEGIPAVLDDSIPFQWIHSVKDRLG